MTFPIARFSKPTRSALLAAPLLLVLGTVGCQTFSDVPSGGGKGSGSPGSQGPSSSSSSSAPDPAASSPTPGAPAAPPNDPLSATRLLRRTLLTLTGVGPSADQIDEMQSASAADRETILNRAVDQALASVAFYKQMNAFGHDWFRVGSYNLGGANESNWLGGMQATLQVCDPASPHPGALAIYEDGNLCKNQAPDGSPTVPISNSIEPWWAPGTRVTVLGRSGTGVVKNAAGEDCGVVSPSLRVNFLRGGTCSCGPNLIYCVSQDLVYAHESTDLESSQRRQAYEEPARLFAHLAWYDRPLTDLVLGNYSVAPMFLQTMYVRMGRQSDRHPELDALDWWRPSSWKGLADPEHAATDPNAWREFVVESRNPVLLSLSGGAVSSDPKRTYHFDPRTTPGEPIGVPAAGVLTTMGSFSSFPRERVRAARWLETFACHNFVPPPASIVFNAYKRDPATEGTCQYCHQFIDPAAIHFKRWDFQAYSGTPIMPGMGSWHSAAFADYDTEKIRWKIAWLPDTRLTPVTAAQMASNDDARFLDFLPPDQTLLGQKSDGTDGPLGFGKMVVASGEFDRCVAQKLYARFIGQPLSTATESPYIDALAAKFVSGGRKLRPFIRQLLTAPEFRRGL